MTAVALAGAPFPNTPEAAAKRAVYPAAGAGITVTRTNLAGRYAAVLMRGGLIEGAPANAPILVEHFSFGWQALEVVNSRCRLEDHVATAAQRRALMAGMPVPQNESACGGERDLGPVADLEALRQESKENLVPAVVVAGRFAMVSWYGGGGGEKLYRRDASGWTRIAGGGGAMGVDDLRRHGVPAASLCVFASWDPKCPKRAR